MPLQMFLHNLLNVLVQIANKMGFERKINVVTQFRVTLASDCWVRRGSGDQ
jgi:hypothetical protein